MRGSLPLCMVWDAMISSHDQHVQILWTFCDDNHLPLQSSPTSITWCSIKGYVEYAGMSIARIPCIKGGLIIHWRLNTILGSRYAQSQGLPWHHLGDGGDNRHFSMSLDDAMPWAWWYMWKALPCLHTTDNADQGCSLVIAWYIIHLITNHVWSRRQGTQAALIAATHKLGRMSILAWMGRSGVFNSFPASIALFGQSPASHIPLAISNAEIRQIFAVSHVSSPGLPSFTMLYDKLIVFSVLLFVGCQMKLLCLTFRLGWYQPLRTNLGMFSMQRQVCSELWKSELMVYLDWVHYISFTHLLPSSLAAYWAYHRDNNQKCRPMAVGTRWITITSHCFWNPIDKAWTTHLIGPDFWWTT